MRLLLAATGGLAVGGDRGHGGDELGSHCLGDVHGRVCAQRCRWRSEAVWKRVLLGPAFVIEARDVDRENPWPDGQDRQEDKALAHAANHFGHWPTVYGWFRELARRFLFQPLHDMP